MQNLFTRFFERNTSNDMANSRDLQKKKKKAQNTTLDLLPSHPNFTHGSPHTTPVGSSGNLGSPHRIMTAHHGNAGSSSSPKPSSSRKQESSASKILKGIPVFSKLLHQRQGIERLGSLGNSSSSSRARNFLQPLPPNHLKQRGSPSPTTVRQEKFNPLATSGTSLAKALANKVTTSREHFPQFQIGGAASLPLGMLTSQRGSPGRKQDTSNSHTYTGSPRERSLELKVMQSIGQMNPFSLNSQYLASSDRGQLDASTKLSANLSQSKGLVKRPGLISTDLAKVIAKTTNNSRETSEKRGFTSAGSQDDKASFKPKSEVDRVLLEKKKANKEFLSNAKKNNIEECIKLLAQEAGRISADINTKDKDGWTALHHAVNNMNVNFVNVLLYNDARVDVADARGVTPLFIAVGNGSTNIIQILLNAKADCGVQDLSGNTAFHFGAVRQNRSALQMIATNHPDGLAVKNKKGDTALDLLNEELQSEFLDLYQQLISERERLSKQGDFASKSTKIESLRGASTNLSQKELLQPSPTGRVDLKDFKVLGVLGEGSFGSVYLVEKHSNKFYYAMKVLNKQNVISRLPKSNRQRTTW